MKPTVLNQPFDVIGIEPGGFGVEFPRAAGLGDGGDGGCLAVGFGGSFILGGGAALFGVGSRQQQRHGVGGFSGFQQFEGFGVIGVSGCRALLDGFQRVDQALLLAGLRCSRRVGGQHLTGNRERLIGLLLLDGDNRTALLALPIEEPAAEREGCDQRR